MTKLNYRIREGADTINGVPVPKNRIVLMTEGEAAYYVSIGVASLQKTKGRGRTDDKPEA